MDVYVPAACPEKVNGVWTDVEYPVLYLLHGIAGYEGSWEDKGSASDTIEAMIAAGRCKPTILVMPDCNKWPFLERPTHHNNLWKCIFHYGSLRTEHEIELALSDLIDMIDTTFCVSSCAIAGLSDGARMAANIANQRPDRISRVAVFSPVVYKDQIPNDSTKTYYIYAGTKDFFLPNAKRFRHRLDETHNPNYWITFPYGHNWDMWRVCLPHLLQELSRDKP